MKYFQPVAIVAFTIHTAFNILPYAGEAFGGMYLNSRDDVGCETILNIGTLIVFLQAKHVFDMKTSATDAVNIIS